MERRPEPELMDSEEQTQAYAAADFEESNELFAGSLLAVFSDLPAAGHLADLGCGPADICIRMARKLPGWTITGIDAGENMLQRADEAVRSLGLSDRIALRQAYLPDPGLGRGVFDAITSNSLLHHLPDPMTLWESVLQLGRAAAPVLIMDLVRPADEMAAAGLVDAYATDAPPILREDFYNSLLAAYTVSEVEQQLAEAGLQEFRVTRPSDRHWLAAGRLPV
jgi:cyclopropane fatty-acyl-phospholipid synthase-like methyltransferase